MSKKSINKIAAEKMLQLYSENRKHIKQAQALKLIFKQIELGMGDVPRSYNELQEKVASLCNQDLGVLEKALDLSVGNFSLGTVDNHNDPVNLNSSQQFHAALLDEF